MESGLDLSSAGSAWGYDFDVDCTAFAMNSSLPPLNSASQ